MKIILSHDVDHLYWSEHWLNDLYIPKLFYRTLLQYSRGKISIKTATARIAFWSDNRLNRLDELTKFLSDQKLKAHFFFGMDNALGLSYNYLSSKPFIENLIQQGFGVGAHGINFDNFELMQREYARFHEVSGQKSFGVRMHYLRMDSETPTLLNKCGYRFNSSQYEIRAPFKWDNTEMWEFPVSIMESYSVSRTNQSLTNAKDYTLKMLEKAIHADLPYFVINFHDTHFDRGYAVYRDWFIWIVNYLKEMNCSFTTFEDAIDELES